MEDNYLSTIPSIKHFLNSHSINNYDSFAPRIFAELYLQSKTETTTPIITLHHNDKKASGTMMWLQLQFSVFLFDHTRVSPLRIVNMEMSGMPVENSVTMGTQA